MKYIILGGGCFWCLEAVYQKVKGVTKVVSGYSGGYEVDPGYQEVSSKTTGHAEVVKVEYNEKLADLKTILDIFWTIHDPTTMNRQGGDVGPQYRSVIFYQNEEQKRMIQDSIQKAQEEFSDPIVTQVVKEIPFYNAEDYHQNYYNNNKSSGYCRIVIEPKLQKFLRSHLNQAS